MFVYTIGRSSGPGFFASFQRKGVRDNLLVVGMLLLAAVLLVGAALLLDLKPTLAAGLFAGSLTNTPALACLLEQSRNELSNIGYATVFPVATITKILFAQLILAFL